jgi:hypothetical protein
MTTYFVGTGLRVHDASDLNLGYDLEVTDAHGVSVHKVEVKGTSAQTPGSFLTRNERACSMREPTWRLAVVTDALGLAKSRVYTPKDMEELFEFDALVWRLRPGDLRVLSTTLHRVPFALCPAARLAFAHRVFVSRNVSKNTVGRGRLASDGVGRSRLSC